MTTSVSTHAAATLNPTRQQLDELDALLQRMLELPVNKLEEEQADEEQVEDDELAVEPASPVQPSFSHPMIPVEETPPARSPVSYMVVETASPRPIPPASGFEPQLSVLRPQRVPTTPPEAVPEPPEQREPESNGEPPVPESAPTPTEANEPETWVPLRSTWQPSPQTWPPLADSWHQVNGGDRRPRTSSPRSRAIPSTCRLRSRRCCFPQPRPRRRWKSKRKKRSRRPSSRV